MARPAELRHPAIKPAKEPSWQNNHRHTWDPGMGTLMLLDGTVVNVAAETTWGKRGYFHHAGRWWAFGFYDPLVDSRGKPEEFCLKAVTA